MDSAGNGDASAAGRLISVNVGLPKDVDTGQRIVETAIWKGRSRAGCRCATTTSTATGRPT